MNVGTFLLGGFHIWCILTNQSTIEWQKNWIARNEARKRSIKWQNPYCLGWKQNLQSVFGESLVYAFFPWWGGFFEPHRTAQKKLGGMLWEKRPEWCGKK